MRWLDSGPFWPRRAPRAHGDRLHIGGAVVRLSVNTRARRVSLRLDVARREVVATAPSRDRLDQAAAFAQSRAEWIAGRLAHLAPIEPFRPGDVITLRGQPCRLESGSGRSAARVVAGMPGESARLTAQGEGAAFGRAVVRALRREALLTLSAGTDRIAEQLGQPPPHVAVADARGRWGSCRAACDGEVARIRYSWRLICSPPFVLDYVVAHECAHLVEPNHGPAFWALTRALHGDVEPARDWLRRHGATLQALGGPEAR